MSDALVSAIVCVYNRPVQVIACLESLARQDHSPLEIVVVDDASTDDTPKALEGFSRDHPDLTVRIVRNARNLGVSGARNAGLAVSRGQFVAFTDSDCEADPGWIRELVAAFQAPETAAVSGTVIDAPPRTWAEWSYVGTCQVGKGGVQGRPLIGNNMAFRGPLARQFRFEPALAYGCDEDEIAWRLEEAGYRFAFAPGAVVHHDHPFDLTGYLRMAYRQGQGSARYGYKRGRYLGKDLVFLVAAFLTLPLVLFRGRVALVPAACFALQLGAMAFNEMAFKGKRLGTALGALPMSLLYNVVKAWSLGRTLLGISLGKEQGLTRSKQLYSDGVVTPPEEPAQASGMRESGAQDGA